MVAPLTAAEVVALDVAKEDLVDKHTQSLDQARRAVSLKADIADLQAKLAVKQAEFAQLDQDLAASEASFLNFVLAKIAAAP